MKGTGEYSNDWHEIALRVKADAGWCCVRCGIDHQLGHILTVHHLDGDKGNNAWWNLVALCQQCHLHIQAKVKMPQPYLYPHSEWFKPYVAGYYAHLGGLPEDREYVLGHLDELLQFFNSTM